MPLSSIEPQGPAPVIIGKVLSEIYISISPISAMPRSPITMLGIEQSPEMAEIVTDDMRDAVRLYYADVVSCSFTHDVLQSSAAIARIRQLAKPRARLTIVGARALPWWWGWPVNLFMLWRARRYVATFHGLRDPCALLRLHCETLELKGAWHAGTSYLATGRLCIYHDIADG